MAMNESDLSPGLPVYEVEKRMLEELVVFHLFDTHIAALTNVVSTEKIVMLGTSCHERFVRTWADFTHPLRCSVSCVSVDFNYVDSPSFKGSCPTLERSHYP